MMIQIRKGVFETNSSSSHSVSVHRQGLVHNMMPIDKTDNKIHVKLRDFGWDWIAYTEQIDKLSYLVTLLANLNGVYIYDLRTKKNKQAAREEIDDFMQSDDFEQVNDAVAKYAKCDGVYIDTSSGSIDHQSYCDYGGLWSFLSTYNLDSIEEFIFDPGIVVKTGNDNGGAPFGWFDEEDDGFYEDGIEDIASDLIESVKQFVGKAKHKTDEKNGKSIGQYQDKIIDYIQKITKKT